MSRALLRRVAEGCSLDRPSGPLRRTLPDVRHDTVTLDDAVESARTGDLWLFRGSTPADRAIQVATRSPVNHVAMTVVLDGGPPLLWHADAGRPLPDAWSGEFHGGAQLHDLRSAVVFWARRYRQRAWLRRVQATFDPNAVQDAVRRTIAALDGAPYPSPARLASGWLRGRLPSRDLAPGPAVDCAQVVALAYDAMGLLRFRRRPSWYDPGRFWRERRLGLAAGVRLADAVPVRVPDPDPVLSRAL